MMSPDQQDGVPSRDENQPCHPFPSDNSIPQDSPAAEQMGAGGQFAPITQPGPNAVPEPRRSGWPIIFGIIMILLAAFGLLSILSAIAFQILGPEFSEKLSGAPTPELTTLSLVQMVLQTVVAVLLLVASIGLLRRKRSAVKTVLIYSLLRMLVAVLGTVILFDYGPEMFANSNAQLPAGFEKLLFNISVAIGLFWGLGFPAFLLIWFNRKSIRQETKQWA